jgi:bacterioferritin-associated ferredoxin
MKIDSCICYKKSFRRIYKEATENGIDNLEDLRDIMNICKKCEMCNPYIREMFLTQKFEFTEIIP